MRRSRRWWMINIGLLVVAGVCAWIAVNGGTYTEVVTKDEVQRLSVAGIEKWEASPPQPKAVHLSNVQIDFDAALVNLDANTTVKLGSRLFHADVHASGTPEYRNRAFYFHLTGIKFSNVKSEKIDGSPVVDRLKGVLADKTREFAHQHGFEPVTEVLKAQFDSWVTNHAMKLIATALENHPIYTLKTTKRNDLITMVALEKIEVVDGTLHITISALQIGFTILLSIVCVVGLAAMVVVGLLSTNTRNS